MSDIDRTRPPGRGPLRPFDFPAVSQRALSNGTPVYYAQSSGFGVVTLSVMVNAGGVHDGRERSGLAALTASLLESGAGERSAAELAETIERLGLQLGTGAGWDTAHVDATGLATAFETTASIVADLVRRPTFPSSEVDRLRGQQIAGILQRRAEPRSLANEMAGRFIFDDRSPFSRPLGGNRETVDGLTAQDIERFHASRFTASGSAIVIAGEIDEDDAVAVLEREFGGWAGAPDIVDEPLVAPRFDERSVVLVHRPGSVQSEIRAGHIGISRETPDYFPIIVMNAILGGAFSSRLNMNLRERHGFTYGISSGFAMRRRPGPFLISTAVQTEVTAAALSEIFRELDGIRAAQVEQNELDDARNYIAGTFPLRLQTTDGLASRIAEIAVHHLPLDYYDDYRDRVMAVTREEVARVAETHLHPHRTVVTVVGDADVIRSDVEGLGLGEVMVVDAGGNPLGS